MNAEAARIARRAAQGARQTREALEAVDEALRQRQALRRERQAARYQRAARMDRLPRVGKARGPIQATDPIVRRVLALVAASGQTDTYILKRAKLSHLQLSLWRSGASGASVASVSRVLNVIGATCRIEDDNAVTVLPLSLNALRRAVGRVSE